MPLRLAQLALFLASIACNDSVDFRDGNNNPIKSNGELRAEYSKTFGAADFREESLSYNFPDQTLTQSFSLVTAADRQTNLTQVDRTIHSEEFTQGSSGSTITENFDLKEAGKLDLLIVVDNSFSMVPHQNNLSTGFDKLFEQISNTNWHIAVVTMTSDCLRENGPITRADFDADPASTKQRFIDAIKAGEKGMAYERGLFYAVKGLNSTTKCKTEDDTITTTQNWRRNDAQTAILIISDEPNCGAAPTENANCKAEPETDESPNYLLDAVPAGTQIFGIFKQESAAVCKDLRFGDPDPTVYWEVVNKSGGLWGNICESNFDPILGQISAKIADQFIYEFDLKSLPESGSLEVKIDDVLQTSDTYTVTDKKLKLNNQKPNSGLNLEVKYLTGVKPIVKDYTLKTKAANGTLEITVDGKKIAADGYTQTADNFVSLAETPAELAKVKITYRDGTESLNTRFNLADSEFLKERLIISVDGIEITDYTLDEDQGFVDFKTPPTDGAKVVVNYLKDEDLTKKYRVTGVEPHQIRDWKIIDATSRKTVGAVMENGELIIKDAEITNGRKVAATYTTWLPKDKVDIKLAYKVHAQSFKVSTTTDDDNCKNYEIVDGHLIYNCSANEIKKVDLSYQYVEKMHTSYTVKRNFDYVTIWKVHINGQEFTDFSRDGNTVTIDAQHLKPEDQVKVTIKPEPIPHFED